MEKVVVKNVVVKMGKGLPVFNPHAAGIDIGDTLHCVAISDGIQFDQLRLAPRLHIGEVPRRTIPVAGVEGKALGGKNPVDVKDEINVGAVDEFKDTFSHSILYFQQIIPAGVILDTHYP